jgi:DeoR/GlpR family transcriptional regulator of sugar metabolism
VNTEELCARFKSSKSNILRDLIELERNGALRRIHSRAISLQTRDGIMNFSHLPDSCHEEKTHIGKAVAAMVEDGQAVIQAAAQRWSRSPVA